MNAIHSESPERLPYPVTINKRFCDLTGRIFGRLTVTGFSHRKPRNGGGFYYWWECRCACGATRKVKERSLLGGTQSCGCLRKELFWHRNTKHGQCGTPEYIAWQNMNERCRNPINPRYEIYGARGIKVCEAWQSFSVFLNDMGLRPSQNHSIERIDNNGGYEPKNCRWATDKEQMRNTRLTVRITHDGKTMCLTDWAELLGIKVATLKGRLMLGWTMDRAFTQPVRKHTVNRSKTLKAA